MMNVDNYTKLIRDFPQLFKDAGASPYDSCMAFGCECSDGWYDLIYQACKDITAVDPEAYLLQVKEKFGGLRLYIAGNEAAQDLASAAEERSYEICEQCGSKEDVTSEGSWVTTLCDVCRRRQ